MQKIFLSLAVLLTSCFSHAVSLSCTSATGYLIVANVAGPRTLSNFKMFIKQNNSWVFDDGGKGPFTGTVNSNARKPQWQGDIVYTGLTGGDCVEGTCTTLVLPDKLDQRIGQTVSGYAVTKTDQAAGSEGLSCSVKQYGN